MQRNVGLKFSEIQSIFGSSKIKWSFGFISRLFDKKLKTFEANKAEG